MSAFVPNPRQKEAIEHVHGPMVVIAGAGTGKTRVLVERAACLVSAGEARPEEILAVTYTDKAAAEMRERLAARIGEGLSPARAGFARDGVVACTFHSLCYGILQRAGQNFRLIDEKDLWILLRRRLDQLGLQYYVKAARPHEFLNALLDFFSRCQDELVDAARFSAYVDELRAGKHTPLRVTKAKKACDVTPAEHLERCAEIARVFARVETLLRDANLGTYGDMITSAVRLLRSDAAILQREQARARFLLIDEFQDANVAQIEVARLLAGAERNVFAVGDPDQAIFRFRGASTAAFEEFFHRFPGTPAVVLDENQRSTSKILNCAYTIIDANPAVDCRLPGGEEYQRCPLRSAREQSAGAEGKPLTPQNVEIVLHGGKEQEAADIVACVDELRAAGQDDIAVIYRQHKHGEEMAHALAKRKIPFVVKGIDIFNTAVIRDLLACIASVASLSDSEALFRVAALPMFEVNGDVMRNTLASSARDASFVALLKKIPGGEHVLAAVEKARGYAASVDWHAAKVCAYVVRAFGFDSSDDPVCIFLEFADSWRNKPITEADTLQEFIEYLDLFREAGGKLELPAPAVEGAVQLMTVHAAKGLEFDTVFLLRAGSGSFPTNYREALFEFPQALRTMPLTDDSKQIHREEERRLFYVALTRACNSLRVYARPGTGKETTPNGFLRELMKSPFARGCWSQHDARPCTATIEDGAAPASGVASWLLMRPRPILAQRPLSATSIDAYDTCPLKYKLMQDWRIPGPASASMIYGMIVHEMLRDVHQAIIAGRPRSEGEVLQRFCERLAEAAFDDDYQRTLFEQQGVRHLSAYLTLLGASPLPPVLHAERSFDVKLDGVCVRGRIDRVDWLDATRVRVIDFKTGSPFDQKKADDSLQLSIYAIAARQALNAEPAELVIHNLYDNSAVVTMRTQEALQETRVKIAEVAAGIAAEHFEPKPGFACGWCEFRKLCPATEQKMYRIATAVGAG